MYVCVCVGLYRRADYGFDLRTIWWEAKASYSKIWVIWQQERWERERNGKCKYESTTLRFCVREKFNHYFQCKIPHILLRVAFVCVFVFCNFCVFCWGKMIVEIYRKKTIIIKKKTGITELGRAYVSWWISWERTSESVVVIWTIRITICLETPHVTATLPN